MGSSSERLDLNREIFLAYEESLQTDKETDEKPEDKITAGEKREEIRKNREELVLNEPDLTSPSTVILVKHESMGVLKCIFPEGAKIR